MTSQCSMRTPSSIRRISAAIQFTGAPNPENRLADDDIVTAGHHLTDPPVRRASDKRFLRWTAEKECTARSRGRIEELNAVYRRHVRDSRRKFRTWTDTERGEGVRLAQAGLEKRGTEGV